MKLYIGQDNQQLRNRLQQIIDENCKGNVGNQIALIENLSTVLSHNIKLVEAVKIENDKSWRYNCYTYAFRLLDSPEFMDISDRYPFLFANSSFVVYLVERHLTEIKQNNIKNDDYIIYFRHSEPLHAGRIRNHKIVSKWGMYHLWEHGVWEVPIEYGDKVSFFKQVSIEELVEAFKTWVDTCR